jgi:hypothetical protein
VLKVSPTPEVSKVLDHSNRKNRLIKGNYSKPQINIKDYEGTIVEQTLNEIDPSWEQPGDPAKGAQRIVDLLRGDWPGSEIGKKIPARLALGDDAYESVKEMYGKRLKANEEWREWSSGVNFES